MQHRPASQFDREHLHEYVIYGQFRGRWWAEYCAGNDVALSHDIAALRPGEQLLFIREGRA